MSFATRALSIGSVASATIGGSLLHPLVTGATSSTTHQGAPIGVGLVPAAAAFIALALLLGFVAYAPSTVVRLVRSTGLTARHLAPRPSSLMAVVTAGLLVSAAAAGGALGPDAQRAYQEDAPVGEAQAIACGGVCIATGVGIAVGMASGYVATEYLAGDDTSDVYQEADTTETHVSLSTHADTIASDQHTLNVVMSNQVNDGSRSVAWSKGKAAAIEAMNNGSTKAETKTAATEAVEEYYSTMEVNMINSFNRSANRLLYLNSVHENTTGLSGSFAKAALGSDYPVHGEHADYTLRNGTVVTTQQFERDDGSSKHLWIANEDLSGWTGSSDYVFSSSDGSNIGAAYEANVTSSLPDNTVIDGHNASLVFNDIQSANSAMESNLDLWVDNTYDGYTAGDINSSDVLDPTTVAQEFSSDYNSTGYYAYAAADLAIQGTNGTLNQSMVFDLHNGSAGRTSNETLNGTLFTDWEPAVTNGSFHTGQTYNADNSSSLVYVATNDGLRVIEGDFHIVEMVNTQTGETVENTTLQNYNRQTAEAGWNESQYQQLLELRQELDAAQAAAAGGSGGSEALLLVALAAGALALIARREGH
jgi:hypothetical protein